MNNFYNLLTLLCRKAHLPAVLLMALLSGLNVHADVVIDETTFPDANFRNYILSQSYGADGVLTDNEIANVSVINCQEQNIASLEGIGYFTALRTLYCSHNQLTVLDISKNIELSGLYCAYNQLIALDVSKHVEMTALDCSANQLTALDVSKNTEMFHLDCQENQLTALDVSNNTKLTRLVCGMNQLTALDVSQNTALTYLTCQANQLTTLDVSHNSELEDFVCFRNPLKAIDVTNNKKLITLFCAENGLSSLDVSKNTLLKTLDCAFNQLTDIDVSNNILLLQLQCHDNQLTSLDITKNTALHHFDCGYNQLTTLDVSKNTEMNHLDCRRNQLTDLDLSNNAVLTYLSYSEQIRDFTAESGLTAEGEAYYYLRLDENIDNDRPIWERMTETNVGGVESKFDPSKVIEWHGGTVIEGQKRAATTANDVNPQNVIGKILLLSDVTEDSNSNTASGSVSYNYNVNNAFDSNGEFGNFILNWTAPIPHNPVTEVTDLRESRKSVGVTYTNLAGQVSDAPFNGVNIVITRFDDGSTRTEKVIK